MDKKRLNDTLNAAIGIHILVEEILRSEEKPQEPSPEGIMGA